MHRLFFLFFFFNDTATTEIYTLSLHDALPISAGAQCAATVLLVFNLDAPAQLQPRPQQGEALGPQSSRRLQHSAGLRSEEHTSELQSRQYLVCRLLLEKKKKQRKFSRR